MPAGTSSAGADAGADADEDAAADAGGDAETVGGSGCANGLRDVEVVVACVAITADDDAGVKAVVAGGTTDATTCDFCQRT